MTPTNLNTWVDTIKKILDRVEPLSPEEQTAINNAMHVFKYGKGWLTDDNPVKIFFFSDFYDCDAE